MKQLNLLDPNYFKDQIIENMKRENELRGYARLFLINDLLGQLATNLKNKHWKIKDLREYFELTHKKHGKYVNYFGHCFKCFTPLKADYTKFENYCQDC
jgi:hypothetical protein